MILEAYISANKSETVGNSSKWHIIKVIYNKHPIKKSRVFALFGLPETYHWINIILSVDLDLMKTYKFNKKKMPQSGVGSMQGSNEDCLPMKGHTQGGGRTHSVTN